MKQGESKDNVPWWQPSMMLFFRLSSWIAGPVILSVFLGRWLDQKYGTEPWLFLFCVGAAFSLSMFGMVRDAMREMKRIEEENQKSKDQAKNDKPNGKNNLG